jgi:hypothetical protein
LEQPILWTSVATSASLLCRSCPGIFEHHHTPFEFHVLYQFGRAACILLKSQAFTALTVSLIDQCSKMVFSALVETSSCLPASKFSPGKACLCFFTVGFLCQWAHKEDWARLPEI